jgi:translocation and assembly module TamB
MVRDAQLRLLTTGEQYSDIRANLRFNGARAEVKELHVGSSTGDAQLKGWLEFGGYELSGLELILDADEFTAMNTPAISAKVNADLRLQGSQDDMSLSGNLTVPQARIRIDNLPTSEAADVEPWQLTVSGVYGPGPEQAKSGDGKALGPEKKAPLPFLRSDIQVDIPKNVWVQGEGTAVELFGDVQIHKKLQQPFVLGGYVETLRGFASFLGKKFDIEKGRVDFTGSKQIDPELNITATQQVSDYTVYVDVTGRSKKPDLNFRSTPELEQADIISLLVFGKTTDRLSGSEQSNLSNKAGQLAGSMAAGVLEGVLGKSFGFDTVAIDPGDDESASSFGVGRYITQDLYLSYDRIIRDPKKDNRGGNTVSLEYSISRNFKIEASSSDIGETALDFNWTFDY